MLRLVPLLFLLPNLVFADLLDSLPERRKSQYETVPGEAILPFPYSIPGIGSGLSLLGGFSNIKGSYTDVYGMIIGGDVRGAALGIDDIHLLHKRLILQVGVGAINRVSIQQYSSRGMRSEKDDYMLVDLSGVDSIGGRLTTTFFDRRLELYAIYYKYWATLERITDSDGEAIVEVDNPSSDSAEQKTAGVRFDFTDDYNDPRRGFRLDVGGWYSGNKQKEPEYVLLDMNATGYFPIGKRSTWLVNLFKSDVIMLNEGELDRAIVSDELGLDCTSVVDPVDQVQCNKFIDTTLAHNKYGTASSLGGFSRLRSYSQGRYTGAHSLFAGTEFRWNLTDEFTPFDIYIIEDVRTSIQTAFFYEIGSVAERESGLGRTTRSSYGAGVRVVTASGVVFRGDLAYGDEGFAPNIFIGYPWEL